MRFPLLVALLLIAFSDDAKTQIVYGYMNNSLVAYDLSDCSFCTLFPLPSSGNPQLLVLPDGTVIFRDASGLSGTVFDSQGNIIGSFSTSSTISSFELHNGIVYIATANGLSTLDVNTYQVTNIGNWPAGIHTLHGLYSLGGNLFSYDMTNSPPYSIWQVDTTNPSASFFVQNSPATWYVRGVGSAGGLAYYATGGPLIPNAIWSLDPATNTTQIVCNTANVLWGISVYLPGTEPNICCTNSAGNLSGNSYNLCADDPLNASPSIGVNLDNNDILQYALVTDPNDVINTIIAISNTPNFNFDPAIMSIGIAYYLVALAGDELNGNVDPNDPCLDISNTIPVTWRPLPTVDFTVANPNVCAGDCTEVNLGFTGTPPFSLTYSSPGGTATETFTSTTGILQLCPLPGTPAGTLVFDLVNLSDAFCECP